ncbi:MAG: SPFH domain, Band 7 family protein [Candidatus Collierbacteria bacterium GW2011_GWC2_44_18]|uniref:SPFH domain, Band 7 family protein n=2 Tax=Microgenomates group TaxID=1794810 RepID=A0A0G1J7A4_9BACT|nr:MAG: SPFH domain, Band 7 family protein [Microgenomates group bacterium GW2011_GWC1_44_10]KKT49391.1 MAG: SPFH domain, Band 7 family protein [Candidatus Collierbacteria bacterium GW2011_GWC2_44_18]KKT67541.1 MAG: SPFH domain, Band 7 family protein [Candidatus Woesebacteria bacterium GW2011_GWA2_44_33]
MADFDKLVVSFLVDEVVGGFFISVPPGHVACVYDRGAGVLKRVWGPGLHLKIPFWQIAKLFNAQVLEYTIRHGFDLSVKEALGDEPVIATTKDNKAISIEGSILFRLDKANAPLLWENIGDNFVSKVIRPYSRSRIASAFSKFDSKEIGSERSKIEGMLKNELNELFHSSALIIENVLFSEVKTVAPEASRSGQNILSATPTV